MHLSIELIAHLNIDFYRMTANLSDYQNSIFEYQVDLSIDY